MASGSTRRWKRPALLGALGALLIGAAVGAYFIGDATAPTAADAGREREDAYQEAYDGAFSDALAEARTRGLEAGKTAGTKAGTSSGEEAGAGAGEQDVVAAAEPPAPPVDPGAPLTSYCAQHPEIEAELGYCPSLNE